MSFNVLFQSVLIGFIVISPSLSSGLKIYWNIPSSKCHDFKLSPLDVSKYGVIQNDNDEFLGNQITLLDDPGNLPAILEDPETGNAVYRNHGVPQEGDLDNHLQKFEEDVNRLIPDSNYSGIAVIRYDAWRPLFVQNNGKYAVYKNLSLSIDGQRNVKLSSTIANFENHARDFLVSTLSLAKRLRRNAKWGFHGLPLCIDNSGNYIENCIHWVGNANDNLNYLVKNSDIIFPSASFTKDIPSTKRASIIRGQIKEALRLAYNIRNKPRPNVFFYYNFKYADSSEFITGSEHFDSLNAIKYSSADGIVLSGSSPSDFDTRDKCYKFRSYLKNNVERILKLIQS